MDDVYDFYEIAKFNIENSEELTEDQKEVYLNNLENELQEKLNDMEYEITVGNEFAQALAELIEEEYVDLESGLEAIAEYTDLDVEDLVALLEGDYVPTEELVDAIAECFDTTMEDEDVYLGFAYLGLEARQEAGFDLEEDEDEDEDYDYEYEDEYESEDEDYEDDVVMIGDESEELVGSYSESRIYELENQIAEFQAQAAVKDALAHLERKAEVGINEGWLPPMAKRILLGAFDREDDRVGAFSMACEGNGVDMDTQLFGMNYVLEVFERCGPTGLFSRLADEPLTAREAEFEANVDSQARLNYQLYKESR